MEILYSESAIEEYVTYCEREVYSATKKTQNQKIMIKDKKKITLRNHRTWYYNHNRDKQP